MRETFIFLCLCCLSDDYLFQCSPFSCRDYGFMFSLQLNSIVYLCHTFIIHLSAQGLSGCFLFLAVVGRAAMNAAAQMSLEQNIEFFGHSWIIQQFFFLKNFENTPHWFPQLLCQFAIPPRENDGFLLPPQPPAFVVGCSLDLCHSY